MRYSFLSWDDGLSLSISFFCFLEMLFAFCGLELAFFHSSFGFGFVSGVCWDSCSGFFCFFFPLSSLW